jgi:hypothetical protein
VQTTETYSPGGVSLNVRVIGHDRIDFDKRQIRRALRVAGRAVQKEARRQVSRKAISAAGEAPGRQTGTLSRSIKVKVGGGGFWVKVAPQKTEGMKDFYPAFLWYGVKSKPESGRQWRIAPRANYMTIALEAKREASRQVLATALSSALKPR